MKLVVFPFAAAVFMAFCHDAICDTKELIPSDRLTPTSEMPAKDAFGLWTMDRDAFERVEISKDAPHSKRASIHVKDADTGNSNGNLWIFFEGQQLEPLKGKTLRLSAWIKKVSGGDGIGIGLRVKSQDGGWTGQSEFAQVEAGDGWNLYAASLDVPRDAVAAMAVLSCAEGWGRAGEAYFDAIRLTVSDSPVKKDAENETFVSNSQGSRLYLFKNSFLDNWQADGCEIVSAAAFKGAKGLRVNGGGPARRETVIYARKNEDAYYADWSPANRYLDLSAFRDSGGWFEFYVKPRVKLSVCGIPLDVAATTPAEAGWFLCKIPLAKIDRKGLCSHLGSVSIKIEQPLGRDESVAFDEIAFAATAKLERPAFVCKDKTTEDFLAEACETGGPIVDDGRSRPEIKNGGFVWMGRPSFLLGPWICDGSAHTDFGPGTFKKATNQRDFYNKVFDQRVANELGFDSIQLSSAPRIPLARALGLPFCGIESFKTSRSFYNGLGGLPFILDFAWINETNRLLGDESSFSADTSQRKTGFKEFLPFCPEHPLGRRIYEEYMKRGAYSVLKNGGNPFVYELFNEACYDCRCEFNKKAFHTELRKRYHDIATANQAWGSSFKSFEDAVFMKAKFESCPGLYVDWCKFAGTRYAELLRSLAASIREVDKRGNVYFTEQVWQPSLLDGNGAAMDYRKAAEVLDVLAIEGGPDDFGSSAKPRTADAMAEVVEGGRCQYELLADLYTALAKGRKPVINDEMYCQRMHGGKRVPSKKSDIITTLWCEVFHGLSATFEYAWARRSWEWNTLDEAKASAQSAGYKGAQLLNPYNYPQDYFDGFKEFKAELEPFRELVLPSPRLKTAKIAFLHSYPTLRLSTLVPPHFDNRERLVSWYAALLHANYPFEALFEEDLPATDLSRYQAIIVPCAKNSYAETLPTLLNYVRKGGVVLCGPDSFLQDEYGKPIDASAFLVPGKVNRLGKGKVYGLNKPQELCEPLRREGVGKYLEITPLDGLPLEQLEAQMIERDGRRVVLLVNWEDAGSRLVRVKAARGFENADVSDPVEKVQYVKGVDGSIALSLPPQTRRILVFGKSPVKSLKTLTKKDVDNLHRKALEAEHPESESRARERASFAAEREASSNYPPVAEGKCAFIDLTKAANLGFKDEIEGDRKGGWFDQGANDLRGMPLGKRVFSGIPFTIIDPAGNGGKSVAVLCGTNRDWLPEKAENIPVGLTAKNIYFLHAAGWEAPQGTPCLRYRIRYEDGTRVEIPVEFGVKIGGWWNPQALPEAKIALDIPNPVCRHVGLYCFRWSNPYPGKTIRCLDAESMKTDAVPAIAAITLERP
ncbi:MAG: alpha-amylase family protein [Lentisphaeria bacterium]